MKFILIWVAIFGVILFLLPLGINMSNTSHPSVDSKSSHVEYINVYFADDNKVVTMKKEEYILGVLMAEMPASFELEALKAQAVAARTYTEEKLISNGSSSSHPGADICTDYTHCQAYISEENAKKGWGKNASLYFEKCKKAVDETCGIVAVYNQTPIKAVFHAYASGNTENASEVWGGNVEYLKSVESPGDMSAPEFESRVEVPVNEFITALSNEGNIDFSGGIVIGNVTYTQGGSVNEIEICNQKFKGTKLREIFGLKSACFSISVGDQSIVFNVKGYGHGVGLSQYGANYFAKQGLTYEEILKKYYTGITLSKPD